MQVLRGKWRRFGLAMVCVLVGACAGELTARFDDWLFTDIPILANPNRERDLILHDAYGIRGRPDGVYKKWRLNSFGFRGLQIERAAAADAQRIMVLGASEAFGLYERADHEFPAVLQKELHAGDYKNLEIVNASVAGMSLPTMLRYWQNWAFQFQPGIVLIYPSPQFYLDNESPRAQTPRPELEEQPRPVRSRFLERLQDTAKQTELLKALRVRLVLKGDIHLFPRVPPDRLEQYQADLEKLADAVAATGALPVLVTHAFKTPSPPEACDLPELEYFRIFFPRATPTVLASFDRAAQAATIDLGKRRGWPVIDASAKLSGRREWFGDPVHFNDAGSQQMAELLAKEMPSLTSLASQGGR
jgi:hypothetical protein